MTAPIIHPTAEVGRGAVIGNGTLVWHQAQIREHAVIGENSSLGKGAYIDREVHIGARCKIQNYACLYRGVTLEDGVFVGPAVVFTNDRQPRAVNPDGSVKDEEDWKLGETMVLEGASLGAGTIVLPGITIGCWSLVGAGSLVTHDVPDYALVLGQPAKRIGWVCRCSSRLNGELTCIKCGRCYEAKGDRLVLLGPPDRIIGGGQ